MHDIQDRAARDVVRAVQEFPGMRNKAAISLVAEIFGDSDWISGPGDDAAALDDGSGRLVVACGEALLPAFVENDPFGAGVAAVLTNVNDLAATGALPLGIVDTVIGSEELVRQALRGMRHATSLYGVPVVGGHLTMSPGPPSISAFGVGTATTPLSVTNVVAGQSLLVACALGGEMRTDFPFYRAFDARGERCAGDVRVLADIAESGACVAAKDVSMAGFFGSLSMLLEWGGFGAGVNIEALPKPDDVPLARWLCCFPSFSFLLCVPPGREDECADPFLRRGLQAAIVGTVDDSGTVALEWHGERHPVLDVVADPATGLRRNDPR
jgi:uncharacterized protein